jgi:DegT/DnrJ/EryC1/StrS aminotransferase family
VISSGEAEREIEAILRERTGRECVYVPSARLGIYLALVSLLAPGDRVLLSPVTDDVVLFTVLASGLRPVMAPLSIEDGNIDVDAVPERTWASLRAVMTTNLYGLPDRLPELRERCDHRGLVLIEDAAHALHTESGGRPVGSFGEASVFSLSKHLSGVGGVVAPASGARRPALAQRRDQLVSRRLRGVRASDALRPRALSALDRLRLRTPLRSARRAVGVAGRRGHRMPLRPERLRRALPETPAIAAFDAWIRVDKHDYRCAQRPDLLSQTVERLRLIERDRQARIEGVRRLRSLPAGAVGADRGEPRALFRMPLLVEDRAAAGRVLESAGHPLHYVYDPPLDDYAGTEFVDRSPSPEIARWWARHALPVDPLLADSVLDAFRNAPDALTPASGPGAYPRHETPRP